MSDTNDQWIDNLINVPEIEGSLDFPPLSPDFLAKYSEGLNITEDFSNIVGATFNPSNMIVQSPAGISPENNSNHQELSNVVSQAVAFADPNGLQIIAQPFYGTKLRYRSDYEKNENRLGVLKNKTKNSSYQGPAIRIPQCYLDPNGGYFIRVSLVTITYNKSNLHYFHPYELEHPTSEELNDRQNNTVWFPIEREDCISGIKSFPSLRIVKKRASDLKSYGPLRAFDCHNANLQYTSLPQLANIKDMINEYNLDQSQLAFTVGRKVFDNNNKMMTCLDPMTTVFSEEMIEGAGKDGDADGDLPSPNEKSSTSPPICRVYKYAPKYGYDQSEEDMVLFLTNKPEPKKYGEVKVIFQCEIAGHRWSQIVTDLDIKDRMLSFKTPMFPQALDEMKAVDVIIQQESRIIDTIKYFYIAILSNCSNCQWNAIQNRTDVVPNFPNKRRTCMLSPFDFEKDSVVPDAENPSKLESSQESCGRSNSCPLPSTTVDLNEKMMETLATSIETLFLNNDYTQIFRICRSFLRRSPNLIHDAIENNHIDLLLKFIPTTLNDILQLSNELGENALLHATRLDRREIIQALLNKNKSEILLSAMDKKMNNIFHLIALNSVSIETIQFLIDHLRQNSIDIAEKFDHINDDHWTPLQLAIHENNLVATKSFLQYFNVNIYESKDSTGDNLIHLAVRYADLTMIKYLIEDGHLIELGKHSNLHMTPLQLAQSLQHNEIVEYFKAIYPQEEIHDDDSSDDD